MSKTVFIKDLEVAKKLTPDFVEAFEEFVPRWLDRFVPYHHEAREKGVELFEAVHYKQMGTQADRYVKDGIGYYLCHDYSFGGNVLALDADYEGSEEICWHECFRRMFPEVEKDTGKRITNFIYYNSYMSRLSNRKPPYDVVANRVDAYFKNLTGDAECGFSLGSRSFLYFNDRAKGFINCYCLD